MGYTTREKRLVLAASCLAIFVNPLIGTMLNLALPSIGEELGASAHQQGWITSVYFIVSVMFLMPAARLADIYGKKRVFMIGASVAIVSLLLCAAAPNLVSLYILRGLSGISIACISSTSVSMISDVYELRERGAALGINTMCVYLGTSLGPTLGGFVTDTLTWRAIFLFIVPFMAGALVCMSRFGCNIRSTPDEPFALPSAVIYGIAIALTMFGLISLPEIYGFVMMAAGFVAIVLFICRERGVQRPIIDVNMFRNSRFSRSMLALFLNYAAVYCITFFLSLYLQSIGAMTATQAGIVLMAQPVVQVIVTPIAGRMSDRMTDLRILPTVGMIMSSVGILLLMGTGLEMSLPLIVIGQMFCGLGYGLFSAPNTYAVMSYVDKGEYNKASGLIATCRQVGTMTSMGVATCLISVYLGSTAQIAPGNYPLFVQAMSAALIISLAFCIVGAFFSWFRGKPSEQR